MKHPMSSALKLLATAVASIAIVTSSPVVAQGRGGGQGGGNSSTGVTTRTDARANSQGPAHAADRALERANQNSVLSGSTPVGSLANLRTGLMVHDSTGAMLGTVSRINRSPDGTIRNVLVTTNSGGRRVIALSPDSLSINGDVVTSTRLATTNRRR